MAMSPVLSRRQPASTLPASACLLITAFVLSCLSPHVGALSSFRRADRLGRRLGSISRATDGSRFTFIRGSSDESRVSVMAASSSGRRKLLDESNLTGNEGIDINRSPDGSPSPSGQPTVSSVGSTNESAESLPASVNSTDGSSDQSATSSDNSSAVSRPNGGDIAVAPTASASSSEPPATPGLIESPLEKEFRKEPSSTAGVIESWNPPRDRYLLAMCYYGRLSNQVDCMRRYLILAALLNRALLVHDHAVSVGNGILSHWQWSHVFDWEFTRKCLSEGYGGDSSATGAADAGDGSSSRVVTVEEYLKEQQPQLVVDKVLCINPRSCTDALALSESMKGANISLPPLSPFPAFPHLPSSSDLLSALLPFAHVPVISLGNVYLLLLHKGKGEQQQQQQGGEQQQQQGEGAQPDGSRSAVAMLGGDGGRSSVVMQVDVGQPFRTGGCRDVLAPPSAVAGFVAGFQNTYLGHNYAALHMRRSDFSKVFGSLHSSSYLPITSIAEFVVQRLAGSGVKVLFVASDASPTELDLLERLLLSTDASNAMIVVRLPLFTSGSPEHKDFQWVREFLALGGDGGNLRSLAEKHVCAGARVFIGTTASTFSRDIVTLRRLHGTTSEKDSCIGEQ